MSIELPRPGKVVAFFKCKNNKILGLKESYMKYTGLGFQLDLNSFEIMIIDDEISLKDDTESLNFSLFDIGDYKMAVCSHYPVDNYSEYSVNDLYSTVI